MDALLTKYKEKQPEVVFEWHDAETDAHGWTVIDSLRNGAAGGGTRMRKGLSREEVISLAKVMGIKFSVSGPDIGGAKSGIDFDPADPRSKEVLHRWYKAVFPILKHYYGTGGDLNVDEVKDVIPITEALGLWHPQEGVVNGHFHPSPGQKVQVIGQLRYGCTKIVEDADYVPRGPKKYAVADLITGYGVAESVRHYYDLFYRSDLKGKTAIIQGWGNVAAAAGYYLSRQGVRILGIIDREGGVLDEQGMDYDRIRTLFLEKEGNQLRSESMLPFDEMNQRIWQLGAEIFIPGAASKIVTREQIDHLIKGGLQVVSCGANVPFVDDAIFFGPTATYTDEQVGLIPDFIANCGMARVFAYLMKPDAVLTDHGIFRDVSATIQDALEAVRNAQPEKKNHISASALKISLERLMR